MGGGGEPTEVFLSVTETTPGEETPFFVPPTALPDETAIVRDTVEVETGLTDD